MFIFIYLMVMVLTAATYSQALCLTLNAPLQPESEALESRQQQNKSSVHCYIHKHAMTEHAENVSLCETSGEKRLLFTWISFLLWDFSNSLFLIQMEKSICPSFRLLLIPQSLNSRKAADRGRKQRARKTPSLLNTTIVFLTLCMCVDAWFGRHTRGKTNQ